MVLFIQIVIVYIPMSSQLLSPSSQETKLSFIYTCGDSIESECLITIPNFLLKFCIKG